MDCKHRVQCCLLVCFALAGPVLAWGDKGHRIVAEIADTHLTPEARGAMDQFIGTASLAQIATWPDFIRSERPWNLAGTWHYVTVEDDQELDDVLRKAAKSPLPDNAVEAIEYFADILAGDDAKRASFEALIEENSAVPLMRSTEASALAFFIHLVGDIHQPLHVGRGGDRGGNSITVNWFGEQKGLHSVWDSGLIEREGLSFTEFVRFIEQEFEGRASEWDEAALPDWARESRALRHEVYDIWRRTDRDNHLPDLSYQYAHDHIESVKRRLYQAGVRAAATLNAIFGAE